MQQNKEHVSDSVFVQLNQESLPVFCEEGLYRIVINIDLQISLEFENIVPLLGEFHIVSAVKRCIGKFIKDCHRRYSSSNQYIWS